jgi:protein-tyrosine phosphatase
VGDFTAYRVCFVCSGNICRSPMGEVILRAMLEEAGLGDAVVVSSAGTGGWHEGEGADPRTIRTLHRHGYGGSEHVAREFRAEWFAELDLLLAADDGHLRDLHRWAPTSEDRDKVRMLREFDPEAMDAGTLEVDDPWYGGTDSFERCLAEVEAACRGLAAHLANQLQLADRPIHANRAVLSGGPAQTE